MDEAQPVEDGTAPRGPVTVPTPEVRAEIERLLDSDSSLLGEIFRSLREGKTAEEIQQARGATSPNFVWNYERAIRALVEGQLPEAAGVALNVARTFRRLLKSPAISPATAELLHANLDVLDGRAASEAFRAVEDQEAKIATEEAEAVAPSGIYVYTLPHYWHYPFDRESGRTLLKVGRSDRDAVRRFRQQTRTTALPEDPILLRIYVTTEDSAPIERTFHELLEAADHDRSTARTGGREWFLTSVKFLDKIAQTLKLDTRYVLDPEIPEL